MASDVYCEDEDLYLYGLPRGLLAMPGRVVAEVHVSSDVFELDGHAFGTSASRTPVLFRAEAGGSVPTGLVEGTTYYAERLTDSTFQVYAAASGGSPINLTAAGSNVVVAWSLPSLQVREFYSRWVDGFFPAHSVPFDAPVPVFVVGLCAQLAAKHLLLLSGQQSGTMAEMELGAKAQLERYAKGLPVRDTTATARTNLAITSLTTASDPRGWVTMSGSVETIP